MNQDYTNKKTLKKILFIVVINGNFIYIDYKTVSEYIIFIIHISDIWISPDLNFK